MILRQNCNVLTLHNISLGYKGKQKRSDPADMQCGENGQQGAKHDDDEPVDGVRQGNGKPPAPYTPPEGQSRQKQ